MSVELFFEQINLKKQVNIFYQQAYQNQLSRDSDQKDKNFLKKQATMTK